MHRIVSALFALAAACTGLLAAIPSWVQHLAPTELTQVTPDILTATAIHTLVPTAILPIIAIRFRSLPPL